jgi:hypothetical protein
MSEMSGAIGYRLVNKGNTLVYLHLTVLGLAIVVGEVVAEDREAPVKLKYSTILNLLNFVVV